VSGDFSWNTPPYNRFEEFTKRAKTRLLVLKSILTEHAIPFTPVVISGNTHLIAGSGKKIISHNAPGEREIVLVSHYDCVDGSPGANDNAASVFMLIDAAIKLKKNNFPFRIIFTGKEEISGSEGIKSQGSYSLACGLREAGFSGSLFFIFDACGTGDTLVISTLADTLLKDADGEAAAETNNMFSILRTRSLDAAARTQKNSYILMPTPFSDDAGFLRAGLAAQTITVLPAAQARYFAALARSNPLNVLAIISREQQVKRDKLVIPKTWQNMNGPQDTLEKLTTNHFADVVKFILALVV
jgi:Zn-dependent M28 family amino/carboxypeptidase